jgi:hypothetical protein
MTSKLTPFSDQMNQLILIKQSDVYESTPDARGYHQMIMRCGGEIPLNIFATVCSLFSSAFGIPAQDSLEDELLAASVKNKLARFRKNKVGSRHSAIFTRATALLNLKCLLAAVRPGSKFSKTAVGGMALHANDYIDLSLPEADATVLMTELMPMWEIHNPRDVGQVLRRYYYIFNEILSTNEKVIALFSNELHVHPKLLDIDGLHIDDYVALLFGLFAIAARSASSMRTSIIDFSDPTSALDITREEVTSFLKARSLNQESFQAVIGAIDTPEELDSVLGRPEWTTDFSVFRKYPLLELPNGRLLVTDLQFLIENAGAGLFWNTFYRLSKKGRQLFPSYWGEAFETYIQRLAKEHFGPPWTVLTNISGSNFEIDLLLTDGEAAIVIECKAGSLPQSVKTSRDVEKVTRALETKFVTNASGNAKGVRQLVRAAGAVARGEVAAVGNVRRIYPLLVAEDPALATPGTNHFLAQHFANDGPHDPRVSPPTVATVDEFEEVAPYLGANDITWSELLDRRFDSGRVVATPLRNSFVDCVASKHLKRRPNLVTRAAGVQLQQMIEAKYRDRRKDSNEPEVPVAT